LGIFTSGNNCKRCGGISFFYFFGSADLGNKINITGNEASVFDGTVVYVVTEAVIVAASGIGEYGTDDRFYIFL
jgi:hypothetical protein